MFEYEIKVQCGAKQKAFLTCSSYSVIDNIESRWASSNTSESDNQIGRCKFRGELLNVPQITRTHGYHTFCRIEVLKAD